jgi:hypothetical protein
VVGTFRRVEIKSLVLREAVRRPHDYGISIGNNQPQNTHLKFMVLDFPGTPKLATADRSELNRAHSYRKLSTGSIFAARAAGTVPNKMPTSAETTMATIAESPEMGMR